jgi:hypothetical protein
MFAIEEGSEAFAVLQQMMFNPATYKVSMAVRDEQILLKRNEGMWTSPLKVTRIAGDL